MDFGLQDKVALVTGASRGIGRDIAMALAREGARLACVATTPEGAGATAAAIIEAGGDGRAYGCDVAESASVQELAAAVSDDFGGLDVLVNNAGITRDGLLLRMTEEDWDAVLSVNLKGAFNTSRAFARTLMKRGGARIINVASVVGLMGNAGQSNYAASKGGLIAFTKSLARELAGRRVTVNAVAPGFIETDMTESLDDHVREEMRKSIPLGRFGSGGEVADLVVFLAGTTGAYVTGQTFVIDGGMAV